MSRWYLIPHPYRQIGAQIVLAAADRPVIARAFQALVGTGCSYLEAASLLYAGGITPPEGGYWEKITARWFFENPIHCGYLLEVPPGKENGNPVKKSETLTLRPVSIDGGPAVDFETWRSANFDIRQKRLERKETYHQVNRDIVLPDC